MELIDVLTTIKDECGKWIYVPEDLTDDSDHQVSFMIHDLCKKFKHTRELLNPKVINLLKNAVDFAGDGGPDPFKPEERKLMNQFLDNILK